MLPRVMPRRPEPPTRRMSRRVTPRCESQRSLPGWPGMQSIDMTGSLSGVLKAGGCWHSESRVLQSKKQPPKRDQTDFFGGTERGSAQCASRRTIAVLAGECQSFDERYRQLNRGG